MHISIVGAGYVGLVAALCLAEKGHMVTCVDNDLERVDNIENLVIPFFEKGLEPLLKKHINKNFFINSNLQDTVLETDVSFIAVETPVNNGNIDLEAVKQVSKQIGSILRIKEKYHLVIVKSTVVPGTCDNIVRTIIEQNSGKEHGQDFGVAMCPEFLREGQAVNDFMYPDRIIIGGEFKDLKLLSEKIFNVYEGVEIFQTNNKTAEMIKYASNAFFASLISFSNEIGNLCAELDNVDCLDVLKGLHLDKRISPLQGVSGNRIKPEIITYLEAGCGYGGSCFPKDLDAIISFGKNLGQKMSILEAVKEVNAIQYLKIKEKLSKYFSNIGGRNICVLGLGFKENTTDMRGSVALKVIEFLLKENATVYIYDPLITDSILDLFPKGKVEFAPSIEDAIVNSHAAIILTKSEDFKSIPTIFSQRGLDIPLIDGRRLLNKDNFKRYSGIGLA